MWQIITHNLSVTHAQRLFVVTQIAAANLVTGRTTFAKVWGLCPLYARICFYSTVCSTSSLLCINKCWNNLSQDPGHVGQKKKGSRLVIMMSCYHHHLLSNTQYTDEFRWMQTNTADENIHFCNSMVCLYSPQHVGKETSRVICSCDWGVIP